MKYYIEKKQKQARFNSTLRTIPNPELKVSENKELKVKEKQDFISIKVKVV